MDTLTHSFHSAAERDRPQCMVALGLSPPYTAQDVRQAYLAKVRVAHPDTGGDVASFLKVQRAFDEATEYVRHHVSPWFQISDKVQRYIRHDALVEELKKYGAIIEVERDNWLARSWGEDFVQLTERIVGIRLRGPALSDNMLARLVHDRMLLGNLRRLDLAYSTIDDQGLYRLSVLTSLEHLDLRGTLITDRSLKEVVGRLLNLRSLDLRDTLVTWGRRLVLRWSFPLIKMDASSPRSRATSSRVPVAIAHVSKIMGAIFSANGFHPRSRLKIQEFHFPQFNQQEKNGTNWQQLIGDIRCTRHQRNQRR